MAKLVTIEIDQTTGEFSVDLTGFHGKGCGDIVKMFDGLGTKTKGITKPEYKQETINLVRK